MTARNRVIHGSDVIDCDIVREIVAQDFPVLAAEIENARAGAAG